MASTNTPPEIPPRRHSSTVSPNKIINQNSDAESKTKPPPFLSRRHSSCIDDNMDSETDTICLFFALTASSSLLQVSAYPGSNYGYGMAEYTNGQPSSSSSLKSNSGPGQSIATRPNTDQGPYVQHNARPAYDRYQSGAQAADYVAADSGSSSYQYRNQWSPNKRATTPQQYTNQAPQQPLQRENNNFHAAPAASQYYPANNPIQAPRHPLVDATSAGERQHHSGAQAGEGSRRY